MANHRNWAKQLRERSLTLRLLIPVNLICFLILLGSFSLLIYTMDKTNQSVLTRKVENTMTFLVSTGENHIFNFDLPNLAKTVTVAMKDQDLRYVVYYDDKGKQLSDGKEIEAAGVVRVERQLFTEKGESLGRVVIGYSYRELQDSRRNLIAVGAVSMIVTQLLLSIAIWIVARGVMRPLHQSINRLSKTIHTLFSTSKGISSFSSELATGVSQQAEVVQQTTASMAEMSGMLSQTSAYAKQSETIMTSVNQKAINGMSVMNHMVDAMASVKAANDQLMQMHEIISEIGAKTNVINDIVFKTQLLSFNAAIEAARAGQNGRGFAVVAEEVGNLAKLSGQAAEEIASLLKDSEAQVSQIVRNTSERVAVGNHVTEQALRNFTEIASDIKLVSTQVENIALAAREQELGVEQTNRAMSELNKTTDLNNRIATRSHESSDVLSNEVNALEQISRAIEFSILGQDSRKTRSAVELVPKNGNSKSDESHDTANSSATEGVQSRPAPEVTDKILAMAKRQRGSKDSKKHNAS